MGGKAKVAKRLVTAILNDTPERGVWFEPFVGGANVTEHAAQHFTRSIGADAHTDLIMMWQAVTAGFSPPEYVSKDLYTQLRNSSPSALRGFAGFGASFGGKWFGGYSGDHTVRGNPKYTSGQTTYRAVIRQGEVFRARKTEFIQASFGQITPPAGTVVYCDPPYAGTTKYTTGQFDYELFYKTLVKWSESGCVVYTSEYQIPNSVNARVIWSRTKSMPLSSETNTRSVTEKLFRILPSGENA
jgi:DNA adenine methylase